MKKQIRERLTLSALSSRPRSESKLPAALRSSSAQMQIRGAPAATGAMIRGSRYSFGAAQPIRGMNGLRIIGKQIWALARSYTSGTDAIGLWSGSTGNAALTFDPNDSVSMPPPLTALSQVFGRYVLRAAKVLYTPAGQGSNTSDTIGLAFAVTTDAAFARGEAPSSSTTILEMTNSVSGPLWMPMDLEVPCDGELRYIWQGTSDGSITKAEDRQDHAFALFAQFDSTPTASTTYGYFHLEYTLDLYEISNPPLETSLRRAAALCRAQQERQVERKEATPARVEDDRTVPSTPRTSPQEEPSGGWFQIRAPVLTREVPPARVQSAKA